MGLLRRDDPRLVRPVERHPPRRATARLRRPPGRHGRAVARSHIGDDGEAAEAGDERGRAAEQSPATRPTPARTRSPPGAHDEGDIEPVSPEPPP